MNLADAAALKKKGNDLFGRGKYADAVEAYTAAIDLWMETHDRAVLYSNRSAARLKIAGEKQKALSDAERAVQLECMLGAWCAAVATIRSRLWSHNLPPKGAPGIGRRPLAQLVWCKQMSC